MLRPPSERSRDLLAASALALLVLLFFADILLSGLNLYIRDIPRTYYPDRAVIARILRHHDFPFWNPFAPAGQPLAANPAYEIFYPPQWLVALGDLRDLVHLEVVLHYPFTAIGMYLLGRSLRLRRTAAAFGGFAYALGGTMLSLGSLWPFLFAASWIPWVALSFRRAIRDPSPARIAIASICTSAVLLIADVSMVLQMLALVIAYAGYWGWKRRYWRRTAAVAAIIVLVALAIGAVQIISALDHQRDSGRSRPLGLATATTWSISHPPAGDDLADALRCRDIRRPLFLGHRSPLSRRADPVLAGLLPRPSLRGPGDCRLRAPHSRLAVRCGRRGRRLPHGDRSLRSAFPIALPTRSSVGTVSREVLRDSPLHADPVLRDRGPRGPRRRRDAPHDGRHRSRHHHSFGAHRRHHARSRPCGALRRFLAPACDRCRLRATIPARHADDARARRDRGHRVRGRAHVSSPPASVDLAAGPRRPRDPLGRVDAENHRGFLRGAACSAGARGGTGAGSHLQPRRLVASKRAAAVAADRPSAVDHPKRTPAVERELLGIRSRARSRSERNEASPLDRVRPHRRVRPPPPPRPHAAPPANDWSHARHRARSVRPGGRGRSSPVRSHRAGAHRADAQRRPLLFRGPGDVRAGAARCSPLIFSNASLPPHLALADIAFSPAAGEILAARETTNRIEFDVHSAGRGFLVLAVTPHRYWRAAIDGVPTAIHRTNVGFQGVVVEAGRHRVAFQYRNGLVIACGWISLIAFIATASVAALRSRGSPQQSPR